MRAKLLGEEEVRYGEHVLQSLQDGATACALSVGSDRRAPSRLAKGDPDRPNEDALFAMDEGRRCLLAVADAHFGISSSHRIVHLLDEALEHPPADVTDLAAVLATLAGSGAEESDDRSESTLLVAVHDRQTGAGFGASYGDSSFVLVGGGRPPQPLNAKSNAYVTPSDPGSLSVRRARPFHFRTEPGQLLLAFTDGIDECCYRRPDRSVGPSHLQALYDEVGPEPEAYARRLVELALSGVDGHPGGQDNIALVVSRS